MYRVLRFSLFPWKWWQQSKRVSANIQIGFNPTKNHIRSSFLWLDWDYKSWLEFPNCVNLWNRFNAKSWVDCNGARLKKRAWTLWTWFLNLQKCEGDQNLSEPNNWLWIWIRQNHFLFCCTWTFLWLVMLRTLFVVEYVQIWTKGQKSESDVANVANSASVHDREKMVQMWTRCC